MIEKNLKLVQSMVNQAAVNCGRNPLEINLIGVSKKKSVEMITEAFESGLTEVGENYVEEFLEKERRYHPKRLNYHFIGRLPTKKVRKIVGKSSIIHSVDSLKLAKKIDFVCSDEGICQEIFIQVHQGTELTKSGVNPQEIEQLFSEIIDLNNIKIKGLMSIPPFNESARPYFVELRNIRDDLQDKFEVDLPYLSMGMSGDFQEAIEEGSTHIRVGTAIFGSR